MTARSWKQKRNCEISSREPSVIESAASEPFASRADSAIVSSTSASISFTSVAPWAKTSSQAPWT